MIVGLMCRRPCNNSHFPANLVISSETVGSIMSWRMASFSFKPICIGNKGLKGEVLASLYDFDIGHDHTIQYHTFKLVF